MLVKTKHILLYTDDPQVGGVAQYNHSILCGLVKRGYRVTCVQSQKENDIITHQRKLGIQHVWLEFDTVKDFSRTLTNLADAQNILSRAKPDLIIFSDSCPLSDFAAKQVAIQLAIPYIVVNHFVASYLAERFALCLDELSRHYTQAKAVIAVSHENLNLLHQLFRLPQDKGQVIYNGRSRKYFDLPKLSVRERLRREFDIPTEAVVCFTSAQLSVVKGFQYQLEAIRQLKHSSVWSQLYFVWAGSGHLEIQLKEEVKQLGVTKQVKFLGQRWDIPDWLDASDIFVLPSEAEGMPLAVMEAMAKGLPVIASAVSGIPEELGDTGKLLPDPKDNPQATVEELITTIQGWAVNSELRRSIGQAGKSRAEDLFREERMIQETMEVIEQALLPNGDYVSPGFSIILPDHCFPNMIVGNTYATPWAYLRRDIPHNWYVDKRQPTVGFLNRDEVHILYNTALQFKGKRALEIGCWFGWSACHLALAGVKLDVIDPLLARPEFYESVRNSLKAAGVLNSVDLIPGYSPHKVEELTTKLNQKWSLIFIDGNHEAPSPLNDAVTCEKIAEENALVLFHDLVSPDVSQGLDYFKERGWNTMLYQTAQIMGVAWRGNVEPVSHQADPTVQWHLPTHLQSYSISMIPKNQSSNHKFFNKAQEVQAMREQAIELTTIDPLLNWLFHYVENFNINYIYPCVSDNLEPSKFVELNQQGQEFFTQGNFTEALATFTKVIDLNPSSVIAHNYLSHLYWQQNDAQKSLQHHILAQSGHKILGSPDNTEFQEIINAVRPYTLLSESRLLSLYSLAKQICLDDIPGNFVECGSYKGGSAALLAVIIKRYSLRPRLLYAFDTFEGMPDPSEADKHNGIPANLTGFGAGTLKAPIAENLDVICQALEIQDIVIAVQGLFAETLPKNKALVDDIALLHADGDWYDSTMDIFNTLYENVVPNGIIQVDDYGHWEGCRKAVHEFERCQSGLFALRSIDATGVWFRKEDPVHKDCEHWRTFWQLAQTAKKMGHAELTEKATKAVLQIVPRLAKAEEMLVSLQKAISLPSQDVASHDLEEFISQISSWVDQYQKNPTNQALVANLRKARKELADFWLNLPTEQLASFYVDTPGQVHQKLQKTNIQTEALTETEEFFVNELFAQIAKGLNEPQAIQCLLALMLYRGGEQLSLPHELIHIPNWFIKDYLKFILSPRYFQKTGDAKVYYQYISQLVHDIHTNIVNNLESQHWQEIANYFTSLVNFIPLYFNQFNLKNIYKQRADILEANLKNQCNLLECEFSVERFPEPNKIRLGILATHYGMQTETFATLPIYKHLNRDLFEIILFTINTSNHRLERYCAGHADNLVKLPADLANQVQVIREADLDIIFISTNVTAVTHQITLLAMHRLARIQMVDANSPVTTGMPHVDYYISSQLSEPENDAQQHYTETLVKLDSPPQCFDFATENKSLPTTSISRESLGIAKETVVYVSGANYYKIIPEIEEVWARIIASVPNSVLLLYPFNSNWSSSYPVIAFCKRITATLTKHGISEDRLFILDPAPNRADVKERLKLSDIYLDSYPYSGMTSLIDPLEVGLPTVVWEGEYSRSKKGASLLRSLDIHDLITSREEAYTQLAIALGTNPELRQRQSEQIKQKMQATPPFLDSRAYSAKMGALFQNLFRKYLADSLSNNLRLRDINLVIFPDWSKPEELIAQDLANVIRAIATHPDKNYITLLIDTSNISEEDADLAVSSVVMNLLMEEELEVEEGPEISILGKLSDRQWEALLTRLQSRIVLENENQGAIAQAKVDKIPAWEISSLTEKRAVQQETGNWVLEP